MVFSRIHAAGWRQAGLGFALLFFLAAESGAPFWFMLPGKPVFFPGSESGASGALPSACAKATCCCGAEAHASGRCCCAHKRIVPLDAPGLKGKDAAKSVVICGDCGPGSPPSAFPDWKLDPKIMPPGETFERRIAQNDPPAAKRIIVPLPLFADVPTPPPKRA